MKTKRPKNQKTLIILFIFGAGILLIVTLLVVKQYTLKMSAGKTAAKENTQENQKEKKIPALVKLETMKPRDYCDKIKGVTGRIDVARAKLGFEGSGTVEIIAADKGAIVKKGDILAELNTTDLILKEKYKKNALEGSKIELEKAVKILEENREKAKTGFILENKLRDYELDVQLKQNKVKADELEIEAAEENLKKAQLRAPFDGVVLERKIEIGESISSSREAFVLLDINNIFADIEINEKQLSKIEPGQQLFLKTNIFREIIAGKIQSIVPAVQGKAMILCARAKLESSKLTLLPGMFVSGEIQVFEQKNALVIPLQALTKENDTLYVFVYDSAKKTVVRKTVECGYMSADEALITKGLKPGMSAVIESSAALKDGASVKVEAE